MGGLEGFFINWQMDKNLLKSRGETGRKQRVMNETDRLIVG